MKFILPRLRCVSPVGPARYAVWCALHHSAEHPQGLPGQLYVMCPAPFSWAPAGPARSAICDVPCTTQLSTRRACQVNYMWFARHHSVECPQGLPGQLYVMCPAPLSWVFTGPARSAMYDVPSTTQLSVHRACQVSYVWCAQHHSAECPQGLPGQLYVMGPAPLSWVPTGPAMSAIYDVLCTTQLSVHRACHVSYIWCALHHSAECPQGLPCQLYMMCPVPLLSPFR